jgi:Spy/CpxP family protein refolding chaperone
MNRTRLLALAVLAVTFIAGGLLGAGLHHAFRPPPPLGPFQLPERELHLTKEQHVKIDAVMASHQEQITAVTHEVLPRLKPIADEMRAQIREVLTEEQRATLDRIEAEHGGPPPLMPPPRRPPPP